MMGRS